MNLEIYNTCLVNMFYMICFKNNNTIEIILTLSFQ